MTYDNANGAVFSIAKDTDAPTIQSKWYIMFGKVDVQLQVSPGAGVVTSIVLQSDDLDEIDLEWVGGDNTKVQTNYFSRGNTTTYDRGGTHDVVNPQGQFHTYTIDWTKDALTWSIDGNVIRTLRYEEAQGGSQYPQTPMQVKLGTWIAGKPGAPEGTIAWAGGLVDLSKGPFKAFYKSVAVTDYTTGATYYAYGDRSGTYQSIRLLTDPVTNTTTSTAAPRPTGSSTATAGGSSATGSGSAPGADITPGPSQAGNDTSAASRKDMVSLAVVAAAAALGYFVL